MGYNLYIGEPKLVNNEEELYAYYDISTIRLDTAPVFPNDNMTGNSNGRSPSYSVWKEFCRNTGLDDLFYNSEYGLIREHPGICRLTFDHLSIVQDALNKWKEKATLPPGFEGWEKFIDGQWVIPDQGKYDYILARLIWLEFWMNWALNNCKNPAIQNT